MQPLDMFSLTGKVAVVAGGGGVLGGAIAEGLGAAGATVAIADLLPELAQAVAKNITDAGGKAKGYPMDVFAPETVQACCDNVVADFGQVDILVNAVGGNMKGATVSPEQSFFDVPGDALRKVVDLNLVGGTMIPSQVFLKAMLNNADGGSVINVSSMCAFTPLTRVLGYSAARPP